MPSSDLVPGRSCDGCTLCCKVLAIPELAKPRGSVCGHCTWGTGCKTYAQRPSACRDFDCSYLLSPALGEEWKPTTSHMVLGYMAEADIILIYTDPDSAGVWRQAPYYARIKSWAATTETGYVLIWEKDGALALVGTQEFPLGQIRGDQVVVRDKQTGPDGNTVRIYVADRADYETQIKA